MATEFLTDLSFLEPGEQWPPVKEHKRLQKIEENRLLFEGKHERVFKDFWERIERHDGVSTKSYALILNYFKRMTTLIADLLVGEHPEISAEMDGGTDADQETAQSHMDRVIAENELWSKLYQLALDIPPCGTAVLKTYMGTERAYIDVVPPDIYFEVVSESNIRETLYRVLGWVVGEDPDRRLQVEIHSRGAVEYRTYELNSLTIRRQMTDEEFDGVVETGVDEFLVQPIQSILPSSEVYGLDDYQDLESIVGEMAARVSQMSKIMDKHSEPNMYGDSAALEYNPATGQSQIRGGGAYFPVDAGGTEPGYLTWDGQLESNFKLLEFLQEQLYILSETSASAFGQFRSGGAESGTALRLRMIATLAKVNRIRMHMEPVIKRVLRSAMQLEVNAGRPDSMAADYITIDWKDGLPADEKEETTIASMQKDAGLASTERLIRRLHGLEGEALEAEMDRITDEMAAGAAPSPAAAGMLFGEEDEEGET